MSNTKQTVLNIKDGDLVKFYACQPGAPKGTPVQLMVARVIDAGNGIYKRNPTVMTQYGQMEVLRAKLMPR